MEEEKQVTNNELARMINTGFSHVQGQLDKLNGDMTVVKGGLKNLEVGQEHIKKDVKELKHGQERIDHRLMYVAHQHDLDAQNKRLTFVEKTLKIPPQTGYAAFE